MEQVTIVGIDLAKRSFQLHGAGADGSIAFRRKLSREKLLDFLGSQPCCVVAMEACAGAHQWGREIGQLGHEVRLLPPIYVKPFVKRHKNNMADAEAICEAAQRPTMRFVAVKTEEQQASGMLFHTVVHVVHPEASAGPSCANLGRLREWVVAAGASTVVRTGKAGWFISARKSS